MRSPKEIYKENLKNASILRKEYTRLFHNLYITGIESKEGFEKINEEEKIKKIGKFIPGKIYTYKYDPLYKDVLDFYDTRPIVLVNRVFKAETTGNQILSGINLNFLPEQIRVATLERFYRLFIDDIEKSEQYAKEGKIYLNLNKIIAFFKSWKTVLSVFNGSANIGYQYAYRNYIISRIQNLRYIEYQHWELIPFLNPKEIIGASPEEIYNKYWESKLGLMGILKKKIKKHFKKRKK